MSAPARVGSNVEVGAADNLVANACRGRRDPQGTDFGRGATVNTPVSSQSSRDENGREKNGLPVAGSRRDEPRDRH